MEPDLGVVYDARTRDLDLFAIPRKGSIALDLHDLGDHLGGNSTVPSDTKDKRTEQTISVRRVQAGGSAVDVIGERTFPIHEYDTNESIAVKTGPARGRMSGQRDTVRKSRLLQQTT